MILSKNVRLKYNRLYREVAEYYNLDHKIVVNINSDKLDFIPITEFGIPSIGINEVLNHLEKKFSYLTPFYKFFHSDSFNYKISDWKLIFNEMNTVIKKIRDEKTEYLMIKKLEQEQ